MEFKDSNREQVTKGFYSNGGLEVYYFTGNKSEDGQILYQKEGEIEFISTEELTKNLFRIDEKYVENIISVLKKQVNWLEKILEE